MQMRHDVTAFTNECFCAIEAWLTTGKGGVQRAVAVLCLTDSGPTGESMQGHAESQQLLVLLLQLWKHSLDHRFRGVTLRSLWPRLLCVRRRSGYHRVCRCAHQTSTPPSQVVQCERRAGTPQQAW